MTSPDCRLGWVKAWATERNGNFSFIPIQRFTAENVDGIVQVRRDNWVIGKWAKNKSGKWAFHILVWQRGQMQGNKNEEVTRSMLEKYKRDLREGTLEMVHCRILFVPWEG